MSDKDVLIARTKWLELMEDIEIILRPDNDLSAIVRDEELARMGGLISNARKRLRENSGVS